MIEKLKFCLDAIKRWWIIMILIVMSLSIVSFWLILVRDHWNDRNSVTQDLPVIKAPSEPYPYKGSPKHQPNDPSLNALIYQKLSSEPRSEAEITLAPGPEVPLSKPFSVK